MLHTRVPILGFRSWKSRSWNPDQDQGFFFFLPPFSGGLPRVNTKVFFFFSFHLSRSWKSRSWNTRVFFFSPCSGRLPRVNKRNGIKGGGEERGGIRLQIFRFLGGWVWSEGKKKRQAWADCVRPSRAPTSKHKKVCCIKMKDYINLTT
jgi:hypothetical protein